jgi:hypothetical protein
MKMWVAEGLIETKEEGQLEDYAEDYLEELVQRYVLFHKYNVSKKVCIIIPLYSHFTEIVL